MEYCPICNKPISILEQEVHINKCIFLNSTITEYNDPNTSTTVSQNNSYKPISEQIKPRTLQEFCGHNSLLGKNTFLRLLLENNQITNILLWGPPGCGKTSFLNIIKEICDQNESFTYSSTSAVHCSVNDIVQIVDTAKNDARKGLKHILFIDEIHRLSKRQQNQLLVHMKNGNVTLTCATTENPSFYLSVAFLSLCYVVALQKLTVCDITAIIENATAQLNINIIDDENTLTNMLGNRDRLSIKRSAIRYLAESCDGDARIALNNLEVILQQNNLAVTSSIKEQLKKPHLFYDRNGEEHHNIISAMHESIKAYNDNAALYWTTRMIVGGEDPMFIARRLTRASSEDTGNSDTQALRLAVSVMQACELLERSDTDVLLAQCSVYLARAPTSKQAHSALTLAKQVVLNMKERQPKVPLNLSGMSDRLIKELSDGKISKSFMPPGLETVNFL